MKKKVCQDIGYKNFFKVCFSAVTSFSSSRLLHLQGQETYHIHFVYME